MFTKPILFSFDGGMVKTLVWIEWLQVQIVFQAATTSPAFFVSGWWSWCMSSCLDDVKTQGPVCCRCELSLHVEDRVLYQSLLSLLLFYTLKKSV